MGFKSIYTTLPDVHSPCCPAFFTARCQSDGFKSWIQDYDSKGHRLNEAQIHEGGRVLMGPDSKGREPSGADITQITSPLLSRCYGIPLVSCTSRTPPPRQEKKTSAMTFLFRLILLCRRYPEVPISQESTRVRYPVGGEDPGQVETSEELHLSNLTVMGPGWESMVLPRSRDATCSSEKEPLIMAGPEVGGEKSQEAGSEEGDYENARTKKEKKKVKKKKERKGKERDGQGTRPGVPRY
ncbi:hypothetical protein L209DRAFT_560583 [Thermothelomyces heterothallicus CBS 203.75]